MQRHQFGPTGREVSRIGQGTWRLDEADRATAVATLRRGLELGMTHIDTAELYGDAELVVAEAVAGRRDEAFIVSKVLPSNASRAGTIAACEKSLKRIGTDRLDCCLLHWRGIYPLDETFGAFEDLRQAGKILSWGVSNFDVDDLEEALSVAGPGKIACNQVLYYLQERAIEHGVLQWCQKHGVAVVAYSPFGQGAFPHEASAGGRLLAEIGAAHGATSKQVVLAFLAREPWMFAIPKASSVDHAAENAAAGDLRLSDGEIARIDSAFPRRRWPGSLPML